MEKRLGSLRIALFGSGAQAQRWAWAVAEYASLDSGATHRANAVVLAPGAPEPLLAAREALERGLPVLWACGQTPQPSELASLASAGAEGAFLRFHEPFAAPEAFALLQRFLRGSEPFWRPLYLRMVAGPGQAEGGAEEASIQALATVQALLELKPERVTARAAGQERGDPCALFLTVEYAGGLQLHLTAGVAESKDELVVATPDRVLTLEARQLRIAPRGTACPARERVLIAPVVDPIAREARRFVAAVGSNDSSVANGERWLQVATVWAAARRSLAQGGPVWVRKPVMADIETPPFKLMQGGATSARMAASRRLTLVAS